MHWDLNIQQGTDYDRAVKGLYHVYEALIKVFFFQFNRLCTLGNHPIPVKVTELLYRSARHAQIHKLTLMLVK